MSKNKNSVSALTLVILFFVVVITSVIAGAAIWFAKFMEEAENPFVEETMRPPVIYETPNVGDPSATPGGNVKPTPTPGFDPPPDIVFGKDVINVLLIGYDRDADRDDGETIAFRSDTMMLLTVNKIQKKAYLTSIPRDSYVEIMDLGFKDRINSVPAYATLHNRDVYECIRNTVSDLFGNIPISYHVAIDMDIFVEVVDLLGGIEYDVDVTIKYADGSTALAPGFQKLTGAQALLYVRFRGTPLADIGRVQRQRNFLMAAFSQLKSWNGLTKLPEIFTALGNKMNTNLTYAQVVHLAEYAATTLSTDSIVGETMPGFFKDNEPYWFIDQEKRVHYIYNVFGVSVRPEEQD